MKSRREVIGVLWVAMAMLLLVSSCDSTKQLVSPMAHVTDYQWMTGKINGEVGVRSEELGVGSEEWTFTGNIRMRRDSTIWISVSAFLGMESLRALVTQDSVVLVNRMNQTYLAEPIAALVQILQVPSLRETQALLLGDGTSDRVALQWGPYTVKIRYSDLHWDEPTSFPIKINKNYERVKP